MIHKTLVVGPLQCNCILLGCEKTKEAVLIDPGDEPDRIQAWVEEAGLKVKYLLHTHAHFDHIGATSGLYSQWRVPPCLHAADEAIYNQLPMQGKMFGMEFAPAPAVEKRLSDEEILTFGDYKLQVLHTPGHSPGSICFKSLQGKEDVFSGDTLFHESVGRSDLWGGDQRTLIKSIKDRLFVLEDELEVHPGHGPSTRIGHEKRHNPFLN